jgi:hypothetical protein
LDLEKYYRLATGISKTWKPKTDALLLSQSLENLFDMAQNTSLEFEVMLDSSELPRVDVIARNGEN